MSDQTDSTAWGWWHWRGFIAFGLVVVGAGLFVLLRRDLFAALLVLIVEGIPGKAERVDYSAFRFMDGKLNVPDVPGFGLSLEA